MTAQQLPGLAARRVTSRAVSLLVSDGGCDAPAAAQVAEQQTQQALLYPGLASQPAAGPAAQFASACFPLTGEQGATPD